MQAVNCFRTCDIRGLYPDEVHEELFFRLGQTIAFQYLVDTPILAGCDVRLSSASLKAALTEGLVEAGARVLDAGRLPTPVIYFGRRRLGVGAAAIITASHNPAEYNGLKLLLGEGPASPEQIAALREGLLVKKISRPGGCR